MGVSEGLLGLLDQRYTITESRNRERNSSFVLARTAYYRSGVE
jgi:hypothetical protein